MSRIRLAGDAHTLEWKELRHMGRLDDDDYLARLAPDAVDPTRGAQSLLNELLTAAELAEALDTPAARRWALEHQRLVRDRQPPEQELVRQLDLAGPGRARALLLYAAVRMRRPSVVIETGCFTGWDTSIVLLALTRNAHGHLYTLDLPGYSAGGKDNAAFRASLPCGGLPRDLSPGFLVPRTLRRRWTLRLGDARDLLPALLSELGKPVDFFFHDSEHSYGHMMWEYTTVAPHLAPGAVLASDDLSFNTAFWDFCRGFGLERMLHRSNANVGATLWRG
jgi:predicted O-methyltransferase YrrM